MSAPAFGEDRLYGRQQGKKLRGRQVELMETLLPEVAVSPQTIRSRIEAHGGPAWLEVGFGAGEHLAWQAEANPGTLMIGAEPFMNGVAKLLVHIDDRALGNVAVLHGDVRPLMTHMPDGALTRIFVLHPDPWPKSRHFKRRMISADFLSQATRLLQPGGILRVSSDVPDYVRWTLMLIQRHNRQGTDPAFEWQARCRADWTVRRDDWPQTRYEAKALREGRAPAYLEFVRADD